MAWWQPGSGKSLAAIQAAENLSRGAGYTAVVPAALRSNYRKELDRFTDGQTPVDVVSYNQIGRGYQPRYPDTVVLDEVHRARSTNSAQAAAARQLAENAQNVIALTGTPTINRPGDIAPLLQMLTGKTMTPDEFEARYAGTKTIRPSLLGMLRGEPSREEPTINHEAELRAMLDGHIDHHQTTVKPEGYPDDIKEEDHHVDLSPQQAALYSGVFGKLPWILKYKLKHRYALTDDELVRARSFLTGPRQISSSILPYLGPKGDPLKAFHASGKLTRAYQLLRTKLDEGPDRKGVVFSSFPRAGLEPMAAKLKADNIPHAIFDGKLSDQERKDLVERYNNGRIRVALLGPAASEGISLAGTNVLQLLDPHFNQARLTQAMFRGIRHDSHAGLPPELKNITVQRFYSRVPLRLKDRLLARMGFKQDAKTETVDHYLTNLAAVKEQKTKIFHELLQSVAEHNRGVKVASERVNAADAIRLWRLTTEYPAIVKAAARRFFRPENYDKIRDLPDGRELWAGANDWEAGWTWAWVQEKGKPDTAGEPVEYVNVDHSDCPGCKGTGEDSSAKADSLCVKYGKTQVDKWATGLTKAAAEAQPQFVRVKVPGDKAYLLHHYIGDNYYDHPAGRVAAGEDFRTAAIRELGERTGYTTHRPEDMGEHTVVGDFAEFTVPFHQLRRVAKPGELGGYATHTVFGWPHAGEKTAADRSYLSRYECPHCHGTNAYNGQPGTGTTFRGSGICTDCNKGFSIVGLKLKPVGQGPEIIPTEEQLERRRKSDEWMARMERETEESKHASAVVPGVSTLERLRLAKAYSDMGTPEAYQTKSQILRESIRQDPKAWVADSWLNPQFVGIRHASGWQFHLPLKEISDLPLTLPPQQPVKAL